MILQNAQGDFIALKFPLFDSNFQAEFKMHHKLGGNSETRKFAGFIKKQF